ncbi:hypothetical protein CLI64_15380 [Nostoc sp. CENA543]|uniref:hypothetical protein n=1 Tax=Nostoc sp. CENA543 TaxID=1869241 RepID=UPI000CA39637|nr:hypothetical protein [Nostoc sp. CENA543]AUT01657.1 hypothetical protein CLI64_15380 [Nostoc sp. CENA543]
MTNTQKKPVESVPAKQSNPAVEELVALRQELTELRKDVAAARKRLWLDVASGVAAALIVLGILATMLGEIVKTVSAHAERERINKVMEESRARTEKLRQQMCAIDPSLDECK